MFVEERQKLLKVIYLDMLIRGRKGDLLFFGLIMVLFRKNGGFMPKEIKESKKTKPPNNYSDSSIKVLKGLAGVRQVPTVYIGSISDDGRALHHLIWEITDNSIDEAINGYGKEIFVTIHKDNSITVRDYGRGVPCGINPDTGENTLLAVYGSLHAGGKFEESGYSVSIGSHGLGSSVVNALSKWMKITSFRDGKATSVSFSDGGEKHSPISTKKSSEQGTEVSFLPDDTIFPSIDIDYKYVCEHLREKTYFLDLKFTVKDERTGAVEVLENNKGILALLDDMSSATRIFPPLLFKGGDGIVVEAAIAFTNDYSEKVRSYANLGFTSAGGTHEQGLKQAITRAFNDYGKQSGVLKKALEGSDVREGLVAVVSVMIPEGQLSYDSQIKDKLATVQAKKAVEDLVYDKLKYYLIENPKTAKIVLEKMTKAMQTREAVRKAREDMRSAKNKNKIEKLISSKLSPCRDKNGKNNELFLVEGEHYRPVIALPLISGVNLNKIS